MPAEVFPSVRILRSSASVDRKSTRLNSSHSQISYAVFCLKKTEKLPSFSAPQHAGVRVGACESCKTYVKSIDPDAGRAQGAGDRRSGRALDGPLGGVAGIP